MGQKNDTSSSHEQCQDEDKKLAPNLIHSGILYSSKSGVDTFLWQLAKYLDAVYETMLPKLNLKKQFLENLQKLIIHARANGVQFDHEDEANDIVNIKHNDFTIDHIDDIKGIWVDERFNEYRKAHYNDVWPHLSYYIQKLAVVLDPLYEPNFEDHLRCSQYQNKDAIATYLQNKTMLEIQLADQYMQHSRIFAAKFQYCSVMIFVTALDAYNITDECDPKTKMSYGKELFEEVVNMELFKDCTWILVFTKKDIFKEKMTLSYWEGITDKPYNEAVEVIKGQFISLAKYTAPERIKTFVVNSVDTAEMNEVLKEIMNIIKTTEPKPVWKRKDLK